MKRSNPASMALSTLVLALACGSALAGVLFEDDFSGQVGGPPTHWILGETAKPVALGEGDLWSVREIQGKPTLIYKDVQPINEQQQSTHTVKGFDFAATGDKRLCLDFTMAVNVNYGDYRIGLYQAPLNNHTSVQAVQVRFYPMKDQKNVNLLSFDGKLAVKDNLEFSVPQSLLTGRHIYRIELDYSASDAQPVVRCLSDGTRLFEQKLSAEGGFARSQATQVRLMTRTASTPKWGCEWELQAIRLSSEK